MCIVNQFFTPRRSVHYRWIYILFALTFQGLWLNETFLLRHVMTEKDINKTLSMQMTYLCSLYIFWLLLTNHSLNCQSTSDTLSMRLRALFFFSFWKLETASIIRREIWKRSFVSTIRHFVHTTPIAKVGCLETLAFCVKNDGKHDEERAFRKRTLRLHVNHVFPWPSFCQTKIRKKPVIVAGIFESLSRSVNGKHAMWYQSEICVFKFLQCSSEGA